MFRQTTRGLVKLTAAISAAAFVVAGCGNTDDWVDAKAAEGWAAQYADAANSGYTATAGAEALVLQWTREVKGSLFASPALGVDGYLALNGQTAAGCSLMVWENDNNGRQRWCTRLVLGGGFASPLFDGFDNLYVGQPGYLLSFPPTQWIRWRKPVIGMPLTPRFVAGDRLLVVTHLGQVLIFDAHRGTVDGAPLDLVAGVNPREPERGLDACQSAGPGCPVAAAPAYSAATGIAVLSVWQPGARTPVLVGLRYAADQQPVLSQLWTSEAVASGPVNSPVMAADGKTAYVTARDGRLWAIDTATGEARWSVDPGFDPQFPPSVSPDGLLLVGGASAGAKLVALRDRGDHADEQWRHDDVAPLTAVSQAGGAAAYSVVGDGPNGLALLVVDPADGSTRARLPMPRATGWPVGVAVANDRRVVAATSDGQVFSFGP
ncbi:PQQ-binding-like beta-propeller repeat protein [Mycobacterium sp. MYCO198283]|uniref:PQQ-binding-like beta-propeller repeat protein n=1 Tax=Mycobacterium sp. MYCO198283 TaxID=2883505 RepID=UPI001E3A120E|nr:PQQ-binding-like beta-propeller repeat protein [Mycobacterium sp. MYCO198283]MCG5434362.1 PQQ-binding-like beta-propeller repeat protein [Mycobacterium sp. MYCO198283]